ncbi:MAG: MFS transporter [Streptosporangiaceae bacterium]
MLAARVSMSAGRSLAGVLVPIYLALQGFTGLELAAYVLVVAATSAILSLAIGTISDQVGRRPFLVVLPLVTAAAGLAFAFSRSDPLLFVMGALGSLGRGSGAGAGAVGPYQPAESAFVTEILPSRFRNVAFGRLSFSSSLGAMVGSLLTLLVPSAHLHGAAATAIFRDGFLAVALASALAGLIALGLTEPGRRPVSAAPAPDTPMPDSPMPDTPVPDILATEPESTPPVALAGRSAARLTWPRMPTRSRWLLYRLWITNSLNGVAVGMFGPFVTYWFFRRFGAGAAEVGLLFAIINAATMASSLSAAHLADRWGLVRTVTIMRTAQALLLVPMVLAPTFAIAGGVYFIRMVVQRIGLPLRQSYALGLADPGERGSVAALSNVPSQVAMTVSPLLTGYMMDEVSLALPFELAALFQFLNATSFWVLFHRYPPEEERERAEQGLRSAPEVASPPDTTVPDTTVPARDGQDRAGQ